MAAPLVVIDAVSKNFGAATPALKSIAAGIPSGEITGLVGPDGAGKTTLIRLITGLMSPDAGAISVAGLDSVKQAAAIHEMIGYMPQKFGLYEDLSVSENLNLYADLRDITGERRRQTFARLLAFTGLEPFQSRLAGALSGGMKQKLGLACALIQKPRLLLLDEPSVGVDPISRRELWKMVRELTDDGIAAIWATSYLDEAQQCDRTLLLNEGELLYSGRPEALTAEVEGRTFLLQLRTPTAFRHRRLLERILDLPEVIDGVVQGRDIRLVSAPETGADTLVERIKTLPSLEETAAFSLTPTPPRFEDAFINRLGGGPGGTSPLAEAMRPKQTPGDGREDIIETADLTKRFGSFTATDRVTFAIHRGEVFGFLGPNGAGKSTTFKMLCGLLRPSAGRASVMGYDLGTSPEKARARIGYMAQKFSLYGHLSARQNLEFFAAVYGLRGRQRRDKINQMIDIFSMRAVIDISADQLPLGFKQRLALSCAVMHEPDILFLDEPTSGVDPITRREFWTHINGFVEKGVTIMVTTHFMDEAEYCDRIALIFRARVIASGSPAELKQRVESRDLPDPSLEDAFIRLVENAGTMPS